MCPNIRFVCVYLCIWGCILPFSYTAKINVSKGDRSLMAETHFVFIVIWWGCNGMKMMNKQTDNKLFKRSFSSFFSPSFIRKCFILILKHYVVDILLCIITFMDEIVSFFNIWNLVHDIAHFIWKQNLI